jgi:hypothetical protein
MTEYSVIGLRDNDSDELYIAAVIEGQPPIVDNQTNSGPFQRWATFVTAPDPDEAELLAHAEFVAQNAIEGFGEVLACDPCWEKVHTGLLAQCQDGCNQHVDHDGPCHRKDGDPDRCQVCGQVGRLTPLDVGDLDDEQQERLRLLLEHRADETVVDVACTAETCTWTATASDEDEARDAHMDHRARGQCPDGMDSRPQLVGEQPQRCADGICDCEDAKTIEELLA